MTDTKNTLIADAEQSLVVGVPKNFLPTSFIVKVVVGN
jgi:hypothetical protein